MNLRPTRKGAAPVPADFKELQELTEEEAANVKKRTEALDRLLDDGQMARYKLEVMFSHRHTGRAPTPGLVTWWESGAKLHGGGDSKLYVCDNSVPDPALEGRGCKHIIGESGNCLTHLVCPHCQMVWKPDQLVGEIYYCLPVEKWADVLLKWYTRLELKADIYVKYGRLGIKSAQEQEAEKGLRGELLNKVRSPDQRIKLLYPLKNIIKDTSAGASLRDRILALLKA